MKVIKYQLLLAVALLTGVAIGYFVKSDDARVAAPTESDYKAKATVADKGDAATIAALRHQIAELKKLLSEKGEVSEEAISNAVASVIGRGPRGDRRPRGNPREWLENLKKNEPERYAQMTNRMAQWQRRRSERAHSKIEFLSSIDTSHMSAGARKTHDELQELIAKREDLESQMHDENLTDEQRHQIFEQIRETDHAMRQLNRQERTNLIEETAKNLGFEGETVKEISATLQDVIEVTDDNGRGGMMPPPSDGAPPPDGGPGGPGGR